MLLLGKLMQPEEIILSRLSQSREMNNIRFLSFVAARFYIDLQNHVCTWDTNMEVKLCLGRGQRQLMGQRMSEK